MTALIKWGMGETRLKFILLVILVALFFNSALVYADQTGNFFKQGQPLVSGWKITDVDRHGEFIRLSLKRGNRKTAIEIVESNGIADRWASSYYRVQPVPNANPPLILIDSVVAYLKNIEDLKGRFLPLTNLKFNEEKLEKRQMKRLDAISIKSKEIPLPDLTNERIRLWLILLVLLFLTFLGYAAGVNSAVNRKGNISETLKHIKTDMAKMLLKPVRFLRLVLITLGLQNNYHASSAYYAKRTILFGIEITHTLLFLFVAGLALLFFYFWSTDVPLVGDSYHFLLLAKDCFSGGECHFSGTNSSIDGVFLGGLWVHFLLLMQYADLSLFDAHIIVSITYAFGVAFVFMGCFMFVSRKMAFVSAFLYLFLSLIMVEYPILWNDSLLPFFMGIFIYSVLAVISRGKIFDIAIASIFLALCTECHLITSALVPAFLFILALTERGYGTRYIPASLLMLFTVLAFSYEAHYKNLMYFISSGLIVPIIAGYFIIWFLGFCARDTFKKSWSIEKNLFISHVILLYVIVFLVLLASYGGHSLKIAYFEPALMGLTFFFAHIFITVNYKIIAFFEKTKFSVARAVQLVILVLVVGTVYVSYLYSCDEDDYGWTTREARVLAETLYSKGYNLDYLENHLRSLHRANLLRALLAYEVEDKARYKSTDKDGHDLLVIKLDDYDWLPDKLPEGVYTIDLDDDKKIFVKEFYSIIDRDEVKLCREILDGEESEACIFLPTWKPYGSISKGRNYKEKFYLLESAIPEAFELRGYEDEREKDIKYTLTYKTFLSEKKGHKYISIVNSKFCSQWQIDKIDGLHYQGELPNDSVLLMNTDQAVGTITISSKIAAEQIPKVNFPPIMELDVKDIKIMNNNHKEAVNNLISVYNYTDAKEKENI